MAKEHPKIISTRQIVEHEVGGKPLPPNPYLNMWEVGYKLQSGKQGRYRFASRSKYLKRNQDGFDQTPDAVVIAAFVWDDKGLKVAITHEFRLPLNNYEYGLPAGLIDKGETIEEAAKRELFEETGLTITEFLSVSPPLATSPGLTDEIICMAIVNAEGMVSDKGQEGVEHLSVELMDGLEIRRLFARQGKY